MNKYIFIYVGMIVLLLTGCSTHNDTDNTHDLDAEGLETEGLNENPFNRRVSETKTIGNWSFGPINEDNAYYYEGEELVIDFFVNNLHESPMDFGFILFVDGVPHPSKVETDKDYQYFHKFDLEGEEKKEFQFIIKPSKQDEGETSDINIIGVFHPGFVPGNQETYGVFHRASSTTIQKVILNEHESVIDSTLPIPLKLSNIEYSEEQISTEIREAYQREENENLLDEQVFFELYEVDNYVTLDSGQRYPSKEQIVHDGEEIHFQFRGFGKPGVTYRTTFYLDHQPIAITDHSYLEWETKSGSISTYNITLNADDLNGAHSFYSISVPLNSSEFIPEKTNSLLLLNRELEE